MRPQQGTLFLEKVIQEVDHQDLRELNIPPEIKTDFKVVEHHMPFASLINIAGLLTKGFHLSFLNKN